MSLKHLFEIIAAKPLLRLKDMTQRYACSNATIQRWVRKGIVPKPRYLRGCPYPFWTPSEIADFEKTNLKPCLYLSSIRSTQAKASRQKSAGKSRNDKSSLS